MIKWNSPSQYASKCKCKVDMFPNLIHICTHGRKNAIFHPVMYGKVAAFRPSASPSLNILHTQTYVCVRVCVPVYYYFSICIVSCMLCIHNLIFCFVFSPRIAYACSLVYLVARPYKSVRFWGFAQFESLQNSLKPPS